MATLQFCGCEADYFCPIHAKAFQLHQIVEKTKPMLETLNGTIQERDDYKRSLVALVRLVDDIGVPALRDDPRVQRARRLLERYADVLPPAAPADDLAEPV